MRTSLVEHFTKISSSRENDNYHSNAFPNDKETQPPSHDDDEVAAKVTATANIIK